MTYVKTEEVLYLNSFRIATPHPLAFFSVDIEGKIRPMVHIDFDLRKKFEPSPDQDLFNKLLHDTDSSGNFKYHTNMENKEGRLCEAYYQDTSQIIRESISFEKFDAMGRPPKILRTRTLTPS